MTALGKRVLELRKANGLTQLRLAERAGVGQSLIAALENNRRRYVSARDVECLASALAVTPEEFWQLIPGGKRETRYIPLDIWYKEA